MNVPYKFRRKKNYEILLCVHLKLPNRFKPTFGEWIGVGISRGNFPKIFFEFFDEGLAPDGGFGGDPDILFRLGVLLKSELGSNLKKLRSEVSWGRH